MFELLFEAKKAIFALMLELARHIEVLLLENDCVIIPGFGGFIAHYSDAKMIENEQAYMPPVRTIGFNPRLVLNDGLLIQSYMQVYDTDFSDACKRIEKAVQEITEVISKEGKVEFKGIGELYININNIYDFRPDEKGILSPGLYGLIPFEIIPLKMINRFDGIMATKKNSVESKKTYDIRINRSFLRYTASIAAAVLVFFFMSVPVENTYIEEENYAMLGSGSLFDNIRDKSATTAILFVAERTGEDTPSHLSVVQKKGKQQSRANLHPVSVRTEKVAAPRKSVAKLKEKSAEGLNSQELVQPTKQEAKVKENTPVNKSSDNYNVIISSVASKADAQKMVEQLKSKGHTTATVIEGDGRIRISIASYSSQPEAYRKINQLKENGSFKDAWVLKTK